MSLYLPDHAGRLDVCPVSPLFVMLRFISPVNNSTGIHKRQEVSTALWCAAVPFSSCGSPENIHEIKYVVDEERISCCPLALNTDVGELFIQDCLLGAIPPRFLPQRTA